MLASAYTLAHTPLAAMAGALYITEANGVDSSRERNGSVCDISIQVRRGKRRLYNNFRERRWGLREIWDAVRYTHHSRLCFSSTEKEDVVGG